MTVAREGDGGKEAVRVSLRQKKHVVFAIMLGIPALLCLLLTGLDGAGRYANEALTAAAVLAVAAGFALHLLWVRCPHCGCWLERNDGQYCQNCGGTIDWDDKPGKE